MVFNLPVSPSQTARQTAAFPALTRIYSLQRWAVSSGRRSSVRINRNREETAKGLSFDQAIPKRDRKLVSQTAENNIERDDPRKLLAANSMDHARENPEQASNDASPMVRRPREQARAAWACGASGHLPEHVNSRLRPLGDHNVGTEHTARYWLV
ncbi:hypothetical protein N8I77_006082 [Diaporthe amygdali]|uniref:Uncharacterized protein n=1 Tax=Phomopsis amygdali TaxID=1214568 RepID=A0AAD9SHC6_PHOAM|nr:hypothetical protein N8I77_006082 [Diaporthe amygdali]